jgi:TetR/AcrR family transcriptional regulator, copper-responsive repressor
MLRGRPREFDKQAALNQAMRVFWKKGFDGTSLVDLTNAMNVNPPSIYAAFGDKQSLFEQCVEHYYTTIGAKPMRELTQNSAITTALPRFFRGVVHNIAGSTTPRGCLVVCVLADSAGANAALQERLSQYIKSSDTMLCQRFELAIQKRQLTDQTNPLALARLTNSLRHGMALRARAGEPKSSLLAFAGEAARLVLAVTTNTAMPCALGKM